MDDWLPNERSPSGLRDDPRAVLPFVHACEFAVAARRFQVLVEHASELILVWAVDGAITYASPATVRFARGEDGVEDRRDVIAAGSDIHPDDLERVSEIVRDLWCNPGATARFVARYRRHDGVYRWLAVTITNLLDDKAIAGIVAHSRDVTEEHEAAQALQKREKHVRALLRYSSDMLAMVDANGTLFAPTPSDVLGYAQGSLVGVNTVDLVHPEDLAKASNAFAEVLDRSTNEPVPVTLRVRHVDGSWRWFDVLITNCLDDPAVRAIVINGHDVTGRRQAEEALLANDHFSCAVIDSLAGAVVVLDDAGRIIRANRDWREFFSDSGAADAVYDIGTDYLALCESAASRGIEAAAEIAAGIRAVLSHASELFSIEYAAWGRTGRWYALQATHLAISPGGVVVHQVDITERKRYEQELAHAALHDALTGLPNRALLEDRLNRALHHSEHTGNGVGILFLDIDHFKVLNDGRGHAIGDRLLVGAARRLEEIVGPNDTVARFGGDEFVVMCEDLTDAEELRIVAERLVEAVASPFQVGAEQIFATVSVGVALGGHASQAESLLRDADAAMYQAKEHGRNRYEFFDQDLRARVLRRLSTETELRRALDNDELRVFYQPMVLLDSATLVGVEALVRWDHPDRGLLTPDQFIAVAEESGLVMALGRWVLQTACRQARDWQEIIGQEPFSLAVNLSARQLARRDIVDEVTAAIHNAGLAPERLCLELTETALVDTRHKPVTTLRRLRDLGVRVALDDFGTGYSSLSYLKRFPIQTIKIDRTFVKGLGHNPDDDAIVAATIAIAQTLGLSVIAEGIETDNQRRKLIELGCIYGQGYLFNRPMPADSMTQHLTSKQTLTVSVTR